MFENIPVENIASSLGIREIDQQTLTQFAIEIQAHTLIAFARWCRDSGDTKERVSWSDVAINAELTAAELVAFTVQSC